MILIFRRKLKKDFARGEQHWGFHKKSLAVKSFAFIFSKQLQFFHMKTGRIETHLSNVFIINAWNSYLTRRIFVNWVFMERMLCGLQGSKLMIIYTPSKKHQWRLRLVWKADRPYRSFSGPVFKVNNALTKKWINFSPSLSRLGSPIRYAPNVYQFMYWCAVVRTHDHRFIPLAWKTKLKFTETNLILKSFLHNTQGAWLSVWLWLHYWLSALSSKV